MKNSKIAEKLNKECREKIDKAQSRLTEMKAERSAHKTSSKEWSDCFDRNYSESQRLEQEVRILENRMIQPFCSEAGYSDWYPFEVVEVRTERLIVVRAMKSELDPSWKPDFHVGGFCGHTANNHSQRWNCTSDENAVNIKVRWHEAKGRWGIGTHRRFYCDHAPRKFHDYNF